jgi:transglutaminase-like putative cysteine protease
VADWARSLYRVKDADRKKLAAVAAEQFRAATPEAYTEEVIRFVQDEVRYLGFEEGLNAHMPHTPLDVYNQRFGDCKDKVVVNDAAERPWHRGIPRVGQYILQSIGIGIGTIDV